MIHMPQWHCEIQGLSVRWYEVMVTLCGLAGSSTWPDFESLQSAMHGGSCMQGAGHQSMQDS
jgi:hypothetical protein